MPARQLQPAGPAASKFLAHGQVIDRRAALMQPGKGFPDPAVADDIEIIGFEKLSYVEIGFGD